MKLSEAIRLGAMLKPQGFGGLYSTVRARGWRGLLGKKVQASCAFGAALEACPCGLEPVQTGAATIGLREELGTSGEMALALPRQWLFVHEHRPCPSCGDSMRVFQMISHLNDDHLWTREQIADWVEAIELAQEPKVETVPVVVSEASGSVPSAAPK